MTDLGWLDAIEARYNDWYADPTDDFDADWSTLDFDGGESMEHCIVRNDVPHLLAAVRERDAEIEDLRDEMSDMVRKDWPGLATILEHCYPEDVFPTLEDNPSRDLGPRVVSLLRLLTRERAALARVEALAASYDDAADSIPDTAMGRAAADLWRFRAAEIRAALADPKETE